jgi:Domain of unknown function (DUF4410)
VSPVIRDRIARGDRPPLRHGGYTGPTDFGRLFAEYLAGALQAQGVRAVVVPADEPLPPDIAYVIDGELIHVDPGSWNLRFWIGFGAGRAAVAARTRITNVQTNTHLFDDTQNAHSATWQFQESILRRCAASLARRVVAKIRVDVHF